MSSFAPLRRGSLTALLWLGVAAGSACRSDSERPGSGVPSDLPQARLASRVLYSGPSLAAPSQAVVARDRLVVLDPLGDSLVKVIEAGSGRLERAFGRRGEGPGEFNVPWSAIVPPADPGAVWIYDLD